MYHRSAGCREQKLEERYRIHHEKTADLSKVKSNEESRTRMSRKSRTECHALIVIFFMRV